MVDIAFYALVTLAAAVLVLAMWSCAARGVNQWGPDLTPELLPYIIQEAVRSQQLQEKSSAGVKPKRKLKYAAPSPPSDSAGSPLLVNAHPIGRSEPVRPPPPPPPPKKRAEPVFKNTVVRVLPNECVKQHHLRPTTLRFAPEEPV